jgi:hypothetical protein
MRWKYKQPNYNVKNIKMNEKFHLHIEGHSYALMHSKRKLKINFISTFIIIIIIIIFPNYQLPYIIIQSSSLITRYDHILFSVFTARPIFLIVHSI